MSHMQYEVTEQQWWYEVDGPCGTEWVPEDLCGQLDGAVLGQTSSDAARPVPGELSGYCENRTAWTIVRKQGFGARLSASGYTDCTEWSVFETKSEAEDHLFEMYEQCPVRDGITGEQCKLGDRHPCRHMFLLNVGRKRCSGTCGEERCVLSAGHPSVCLFPVDFRGR